ncbi:MAG: SDR family oxidoreductase [Chloroflexi bacterium]|nr:SDR family oxidoreductase [Chloroflexota bacterium]
MQNRICIVTGANSGIGKATALGLARQNATVIMVCRNPAKGAAAQQDIIRESGNPNVDVMICDMASQASIRQFATDFQARYDRLHVLLHNAAVNMPTRELTSDGIETMFAVNHLAPFLLSRLLLDMLLASVPARIVIVSSIVHRTVRVDFDNLQGEQRFDAWWHYCRTKLMGMLFMHELAHRLEGTGVTANALHPGAIRTNLGHDYGGWMRVFLALVSRFGSSPEKGARTSLYLAMSPEVAGVNGQYFANCRAVEPADRARDDAAAQRLWQISEQLTHTVTKGVTHVHAAPVPYTRFSNSP